MLSRKHDRPIERGERRDAIDAARIAGAAEDEARRFAQERDAVGVYPLHLDRQLAAIGAALGLDDALVMDGAHLRRPVGRDVVGVVPEVEPVHVAVVEPEADVMRVIEALARAAGREGSRA